MGRGGNRSSTTNNTPQNKESGAENWERLEAQWHLRGLGWAICVAGAFPTHALWPVHSGVEGTVSNTHSS